ncbi:MAG: hypothetical protein L0228_17685 [Planctomycetes bacterium]|nr:hypothetical protein [Planctomycetota bacterium]
MSTTTNTGMPPPAIGPTNYRYLERDPLSNYKQLSIKGRRIKARTLYGDFIREVEPMTPAEIAADRDLPLDAVLEAIAYCQSNPPEIGADLRREQALADAMGKNDPNCKLSPTKLLTAQELARIFDE